jgi:GNAT superfamily N-acetyltransferase
MIQIRPFTLNDWDGICQVHDRSRPIELKDSNIEHSFIPMKEDPESAGLQQCRLLVACDGNRVIGFSGSHEEYLGWLYMDPAYAGRGFTKQLLKESLKYIGPHAWTIALAGDKKSQKLYEDEGFTIRNSFISDDEGFPCEVFKMSRG